MDPQLRYVSSLETFKLYPKRSRVGYEMQKSVMKQKVVSHKKMNRCKFLMQNFMRHFSAAGISRIYGASGCGRKMSWILVVIISLLTMTYMTYKVTKEYFEYRMTVQTTNVILSSLEFPAVTVCSPITMPRSRVIDAKVTHLVRMEKFFEEEVANARNGTDQRIECKQDPTCTWSWFNGLCKCLTNPCLSEFCDPGHPLCSCAPVLCQERPGYCFRLNRTSDDDECFCRNRTMDGVGTQEKYYETTKNDFDMDEVPDADVRYLISIIRESKIDDLSDVSSTFQPNMYDTASFGTSFDDLIIGCSFQKISCDKRNFTVMYTPSHGKCYTFNYIGKDSTMVSPLESKKYGWNSGLQLYLKVRDDEIIDILTKEIGITVVVHDPRELPFVSEYGLAVRVGDAAALRILKSQFNRLGYPWGECLNSGKNLIFNYTETPYSQLGCQRSCQNYYINKTCNCIRRTLMPPSVIRPKRTNQYRLCNFTNDTQKMCAEDVIESIENGKISCNCYQACKETLYSTSLTAGHVNKNYFRLVKAAKTLRKENGYFTASNSSKESNLLGLKVYYGTLSLQNVTESPAYSWETLIANIGGNLGFFMGLTLITFIEIAELFWDMVVFILNR